MTGDEKKINKFLELIPDNILDGMFYSLSTSRIIWDSVATILDNYRIYTERHDLEFNDTEINNKYKIFSENIKNIQKFTVFNFFFNKNLKNTYIFYEDEYKKEFPEEYRKKEEELDFLIEKTEKSYIELRKLMENYLLNSEEGIKNEEKKETWITKNNNGKYLFDNNFVDIKNNKAQYFIIFDVVYSLKPNGGDVEYKEIIKQCKKRGLKNITNKKIQKALTGEGNNSDFFRYVKSIKQTPSNGVNLFRAKHDGKFLEFNNKK